MSGASCPAVQQLQTKTCSCCSSRGGAAVSTGEADVAAVRCSASRPAPEVRDSRNKELRIRAQSENNIQMELIFKKTLKDTFNFGCYFLVRYCFYSIPLFRLRAI